MANSPGGQRIHRRCSPAHLRAMTALLLLRPQTPMLFQGQEFCSGTPFCFFSDQDGDLARSVREGRLDFLAQFPSERDPVAQSDMRDPSDPVTFAISKLDWNDLGRNQSWHALHRELLALRRSDPTFCRTGPDDRPVDGAVIGEHAFLLRYSGERSELDRLLIVNLGRDIAIRSLAEPLAAPPAGLAWKVRWSSEHRDYGGDGPRDIDVDRRWVLPGDIALVFVPAMPGERARPAKDELDAWQAKL